MQCRKVRLPHLILTNLPRHRQRYGDPQLGFRRWQPQRRDIQVQLKDSSVGELQGGDSTGVVAGEAGVEAAGTGWLGFIALGYERGLA